MKENINRYRQKILDKGKCIHVCNYENCGLKFASKYTRNLVTHIHNKHLCPFKQRLNIEKTNQINAKIAYFENKHLNKT